MSQFTKYAPCFDKRGRRMEHVDPTAGHRYHIHFGFTRAGANARTSFWRWAVWGADPMRRGPGHADDNGRRPTPEGSRTVGVGCAGGPSSFAQAATGR